MLNNSNSISVWAQMILEKISEKNANASKVKTPQISKIAILYWIISVFPTKNASSCTKRKIRVEIFKKICYNIARFINDMREN